ncbi:hypothetical protein LEP1GSC103_2602 [Leptospira borgpetersenii serovar Javanica str. UI 09931]|uniref:Uncharacterized protein n=1 Tax=Leptospira borgpetersenii serovar Javanica str. UI 09931 TaxID=1049767 RepID=A0AAV3JC25_LEPBO|nr:hypothetical protein LEP1GSC090_1657 [Leptospira borgpetersenii serovar Javanica str. MK146]EMO11222.1 hypothetical protein LEP1GSC137_3004 [Leptospira borgpetersenii str. Noumea 25]EPG58067.1 hypothetical protein LEP1GSC103_2602 [Leptospira borgpetersenii serovar Javanica str. UI 09931]
MNFTLNLSQNCFLYKRHSRNTVISSLNAGTPVLYYEFTK